ncbi:MAG: glycosyltransferase, partial [Rhizomicrobium sp.]
GRRSLEYRAKLPDAQFPRVRILGRRDDIESVVNIFSVGVLTSTNGEGISNAIMEYMALAKPVVATGCDGNGELIVDGETGFLIATRDVAALTDRVERLLDDAALANRMGEAGRRRIAQAFGLERMTAAYATLYRSLVSPRRAAVCSEPP